jgi:adenylate cyclase
MQILSSADANPPHALGEESAELGLPSPDAAEVRAQLDRILNSAEFPHVGRCGIFLTYVVEEALAGRAPRIKAYSIAIEVFKRAEGFTQDDPVVRMEAGRLRRELERYYFIAGQDDPVEISIPKGGYAPLFSWRGSRLLEEVDVTSLSELAPPAMREPDTSALEHFLWRHRWTALCSLILLITAVAGTSLMIGRLMPIGSVAAMRASGPDGPTLVIAPFADLGEGANSGLYASGLTEELLTALPRFKEINVLGRETSHTLVQRSDVEKLSTMVGAQYLLTGGVRISNERVRVTARLVDIASGSILWSQIYDEDLRSRALFTIQADVANQVATAVAQPYGIIAQADTANPPPDDLDAYGCTLRFYAYRAALDVARHREIRECLESAVARYPAYATAWAMLALVYVDEDRFKYDASAGRPAALERGLGAARRAVQLDPDNTRGLQALMTALFFHRDVAEALLVGKQAMAINPNDTELMGEYGTRLALAGHWKDGANVLNTALSRNPGRAGYYHAILALCAYMQYNYGVAAVEIKQADLDKYPLFRLIATAIYAENSMPTEAVREVAIFLKVRPEFSARIAAELTARNIQPRDQTHVINGIRKAGLYIAENTSRGLPSSLVATGF